MLTKTLMILILAMPPLGSADRTIVRLHNNAKRMKAEVLKRIPIGSSIERAKEVMEKSGFDCEMMWNESLLSTTMRGIGGPCAGERISCIATGKKPYSPGSAAGAGKSP